MQFPVLKATELTYRLFFSRISTLIIAPALAIFTFSEVVDFLLKSDGVNTQGGAAALLHSWQAFVASRRGNATQSVETLVEGALVFLLLYALMYLVRLVAGSILWAGGLRFVLRHRTEHSVRFAVGRDEFRILSGWIAIEAALLGAWLLYMTLVVLFIVFAPVFFLRTFMAPVVTGFSLSWLAMIAFAVWFLARSSLSAPAAIAQRTNGLRGSFRATKGNTTRIILFWIATLMPIYGMVFGLYYLGLGVWFFDFPSMLAAINAKPAMSLVLSFVSFLLTSAMLISGSGVAYLLLSGEKTAIT